ncbi:MAG: hypothetical protein KC656_07785 [Myxococcales bacterium]|nr:hypothetical protein [Myxococcales bacterium]
MLALLVLSAPTHAARIDEVHEAAIAKVEQMVWDEEARAVVQGQGLELMNVTWEDTGRDTGSAVGPNISDMTIGVRDHVGQLHPMPVMRFDNFTDKTADVRSDRFWLRVGNADGSEPRSVSLAEVLQNTERYLSSDDGRIRGSLWNARDEHVLVSAQAAFLPVPRKGEATFTPVIYNYQSYEGNPAVATIVATREGTSVQIVDNSGSYMSEVLYFDHEGQRAPFTATRLSDFKASGGDGTHGSVTAASEDGLNTVLVAQVPLKVKTQVRKGWGGMLDDMPPMPMAMTEESRSSDVETAVIGHGDTEGPYKGLAGLTIERDDRFPVRVTVQLYQATSNGVVNAEDVRRLRKQIDRIYAEGDYVGSLVTTAPTDRPTDWRSQPAPRWAGPGFTAGVW